MPETSNIKDLIELIASIIAVLGGVFAFIFAIYKIMEYFFKHSTEHKEYNKKFEKLDKKLNKIDDKIELLTNHILGHSVDSKHNIAQSNSPISLTDEGKKIADDVSAKLLYDTHKEFLKSKVNEKKPENAYDIQFNSFYIVNTQFISHLEKTDATGLKTLKDYAYENGYSLHELLIVFGIYLRDDILKDKGFHSNNEDNNQLKKPS